MWRFFRNLHLDYDAELSAERRPDWSLVGRNVDVGNVVKDEKDKFPERRKEVAKAMPLPRVLGNHP
jgi:hypothetical protein